MSQEIQGIARLKIHPGMLERYKALAAQCAEIVRTKDTGTLQYEIYISADESECLVLERYRDSQSLMEHFQNVGEVASQIFQTCSASGEVCGTLSPELLTQLKGAPINIYKPLNLE